jgi:aspartate-semialdehyde dehydrogenase
VNNILKVSREGREGSEEGLNNFWSSFVTSAAFARRLSPTEHIDTPRAAAILAGLCMNKKPHVAVVGATGAVGIEMIKTLEKRKFDLSKLTLLASTRSVGKKLKFRGAEIAVQELTKDSFAGVDIALFSAGGSISKEFAPIAAKAGCVVIDNSSAFRMDEAVPLVIPEINASDVKSHKGIIANPNCTTAITLMALYPLHKAFTCKRIFASSYQAVSGTGAKAIEELRRQVEQLVKGEPATKEVYPHQIAFNVLPHVDSFLPTGYTKEEMKMENEGRKIMHHPAFKASVTCVRVPVYRAHSVAVSAEFERAVTVEAAREVLKKAPGLDLVDDPAKNEYPLPLYVAEKYNCAVGRIRRDCALDNGLCFWVSGDQLLKGAALNAVQIAEELVKEKLVAAEVTRL